MPSRKFPLLLKFFSTVLLDSDPESDVASVEQYARTLPDSEQPSFTGEIRTLLESGELPMELFGTEANRWFGSDDEARAWLKSLLKGVQQGETTGAAIKVVDSNGTPLQEGDSVSVIKDLKVKGGSSDLKRGTLIRKIHLTSDPGMVECKVDGSVLVLKTQFLKKS